MPYNGAGIFQRVYSWAVDAAANLFIDADRMDTDTNDIASGLTNCVTRDGQSPWLQNLPAGGFKLTGLGSGSNTGDSVNYGQVFVNPVFTNASSANIVSPSDNSQAYATMAAVQQIAFQAALPTIPAGPRQYVLGASNGVAAFIQTPVGATIQAYKLGAL